MDRRGRTYTATAARICSARWESCWGTSSPCANGDSTGRKTLLGPGTAPRGIDLPQSTQRPTFCARSPGEPPGRGHRDALAPSIAARRRHQQLGSGQVRKDLRCGRVPFEYFLKGAFKEDVTTLRSSFWTQ